MKNQTIKKLIEKLIQARDYQDFNIVNINYVIECLNFEKDRNNINARHVADIKKINKIHIKPICKEVKTIWITNNENKKS
jgi:hypothetical protein